jgi:hypothetical protein
MEEGIIILFGEGGNSQSRIGLQIFQLAQRQEKRVSFTDLGEKRSNLPFFEDFFATFNIFSNNN